MYPFMGSPLSFGAARFFRPVQGMNTQGITAAQLLGGNMGQAAPITPRTFQMPQMPMASPVQSMNTPQMMPQRPMMQPMQGLLSRDFGQGGRGGAQMGGGRGLGGRSGGVGRA